MEKFLLENVAVKGFYKIDCILNLLGTKANGTRFVLESFNLKATVVAFMHAFLAL